MREKEVINERNRVNPKFLAVDWWEATGGRGEVWASDRN
jgi:hypothetical protein